MRTIAAIVQSNYLPWKGYFDLMRQADVFVLYDDVQYTRRDWRNRNIIKTPQGLHWLTIPVNAKGNYHEKIEEIKISSKDWIANHWNTMAMSYRKSPGFQEHSRAIHTLLTGCNDFAHLSDINHHLLSGIANLLEIKTPIVRSSDYGKVPGKNENLIHICKAVGATCYVSGPSAASYLDRDLFSQAGLDLQYIDYSGYPEYSQPHGTFTHAVSIVDLLFCTGSKAMQYLKKDTSNVL